MSKKHIPTKDFLNNTIFVISSPQEAVGLILLSNNRPIEYCILIKYIDYTDGKFFEITKRIIEEVEIRNVYILNLYLHNSSMNKGEIFLSIKNILLNKKIIKKFDSDIFQGKLFNNSYNFVVQYYSPLLSLGCYDINRIYLMEHSPADSRSRLSKLNSCNTGTTYHITKNSFFLGCQKITSLIFQGPSKWYSIYKKIKIRIFIKIINKLFPYMSVLENLKNGFSWIDYEDEFQYLDYRNLQLNSDFFGSTGHINHEFKTLLMIDHKAAYKNTGVLYNEMKDIDFVEMYAEILHKHVSINEFIVCKLHPFIVQNLTTLEIEAYKEDMRARFLIAGYQNILFFDEIFHDHLISLMPVELFIKRLKINKIVGLYSSTMLIVQEWDDVEIISDCSWINEFRYLRDCDANIFSIKFKSV